MESNATEEEVISAINAEFGFWKVSGDFQYGNNHNSIFNESTIRVVVMGGDPSIGTQTITQGLQGIKTYIEEGTAFDPSTNPGVPLSYQLKKVKDNSIFNVVIASQYKVQECETLPPNRYSFTFSPSCIGPDNLCPTHIGGDREFGGHGPLVTASANLEIRNEREVWVKIHFHLKETQSNWTEAEGNWNFNIWTAPEGEKIIQIKSPTSSSYTYSDVDITWDVHRPNDLVSRFEINGDTTGKDVGDCSDKDRSALVVCFNPVDLEIEKK